MPRDPRIAELIPHAGTMCLLERILEWNADTIRCATTTHRDAAHPLATPRGLRAVHLCEYGAQAMAVHGGLSAARDGRVARPGVLVSLRDVELRVADLRECPGPLVVEAERVHASDDAWQYRFAVMHEGHLLGRGRATIAARRA